MGQPDFPGNVLRYNSFASIGAGAPMEGPAGRAAIRLDDAISGTIVYGNIFYRASQSFGAINLNGGRDNVMDNNIFAECEKGLPATTMPTTTAGNFWAKIPHSSCPSFIFSGIPVWTMFPTSRA